MSTSNSNNVCPKCGATVPADAPHGLCPKCVFSGAATVIDPNPQPATTGEIPSLARVAAAFPQLEVLELIGRGGMGYVFKARQPHLDRFVALKLLPDKLARDPQFAERFNREGRVLAKLSHPNIVSVFDFGRTEHFYFLTMEYVDGVNLRQAMQAGRFSPSEALTIVPKICEALQYAHEQGVLHRDIKPENILLDAKGRVKIADFGIAKLVDEDPASVTLTGTGAALGTPHYMAPEQLEQPGTVDHRADIYSLGVVFYEMLTGELPIGRFAPPSAKTPVNANVDEVVFRTLEKDRERRFQSAGEVKTRVEHLTKTGAASSEASSAATGGAVGPQGTMVLPTVTRFSWKAIWGAVLTGLGLVLLGGPLGFAALGGLGLGVWELLLVALPGALCALGGTLLGWVTLVEIRDARGARHGLPLALFAALTWPLLALLVGTIALPVLTLAPVGASGWSLALGRVCLLLAPAGVITFALWAVYATARWASGQPVAQRRGVLKWVFLGLLVCGLGFVLASRPDDSKSRLKSFGSTLTAAPLPEGMVELVALSRHPSDGYWWRPDGTPSMEGPFENPGRSVQSQADERAVELVFRTHGLGSDASSPDFVFEGHSVAGGGTGPAVNGQPFPGGFHYAVSFPRSLKKTMIRAGVAIDPWQTLAHTGNSGSADISLARGGQSVKVTFLGAIEDKKGNTVLNVTHNIENHDLRAVAVDAGGKEHPSLLSNKTRESLSATFVNVPLDRIREFRFQVRPYRWTEFKNVPLEPPVGAVESDTSPWIRFTVTAVELREVEGKRWLAIDYLDDVHGHCQKAFAWEATLPGFQAETRTTEFLKEDKDSPPLRHQRFEYRLPDSMRRDQLEQWRGVAEQALKHKSFRLALGEQRLLFQFSTSEEASLKAWIKVVPLVKG